MKKLRELPVGVVLWTIAITILVMLLAGLYRPCECGEWAPYPDPQGRPTIDVQDSGD